MALTCNDVQKFVHPYLDGEFTEAERGELDYHVAECDQCRTYVSHERGFKVRLRDKLALPPAPADLRSRITLALNEEDAANDEQPSRWQHALPITSIVAAAAAIALFVAFPNGRTLELHDTAGVDVDPTVFVDNHPAPVEVTGPIQRVSKELEHQVGVPVRPLQVSTKQNVHFTGARINRLSGFDRVARLEYEFDNRGKQQQLTVQVFDASQRRNIKATHRRRIAGLDVYFASRRGYSFAYFEDNAVGYVFTSDVDIETLAELVRSELTHR